MCVAQMSICQQHTDFDSSATFRDVAIGGTMDLLKCNNNDFLPESKYIVIVFIL
jgi:hypothetical protein